MDSKNESKTYTVSYSSSTSRDSQSVTRGWSKSVMVVDPKGEIAAMCTSHSKASSRGGSWSKPATIFDPLGLSEKTAKK